jgi:hypothetical protein
VTISCRWNRSGAATVYVRIRDLDAIDRELRLLSVVRATMRADYGVVGTSSAMDRLLDECLAAQEHDRKRQGPAPMTMKCHGRRARLTG